ncbi:MAG TPA: CinA family protein [Methylomirabilota bacterium]
MPSFLNPEQQALAQEIAALLTDRGQTVAVAEASSGGLISAALLWVPGASRYYAGGGVLYTLNSRVVLGGAPAERVANYRGTTPEMIGAIAASMRQRTGATWCVAESGLAGPTGGRAGAPPGHTVIGVVGPVSRIEIVETNLNDREANMVEFTTRSLRLFLNVLREAKV